MCTSKRMYSSKRTRKVHVHENETFSLSSVFCGDLSHFFAFLATFPGSAAGQIERSPDLHLI